MALATLLTLFPAAAATALAAADPEVFVFATGYNGPIDNGWFACRGL